MVGVLRHLGLVRRTGMEFQSTWKGWLGHFVETGLCLVDL